MDRQSQNKSNPARSNSAIQTAVPQQQKMVPLTDRASPGIKGDFVRRESSNDIDDNDEEDEATKRVRDLQRIREAERILEEIAKEYSAKRAAGLVPTIPVPARTLLWQELARNDKRRIGTRGQCVYGRDSPSGTLCGCNKYKKKRFPDHKPNPGGICECCNHGAPWHRLVGSSFLKKSITSSSTATKTRRKLNALLKSPSQQTSPMGLESPQPAEPGHPPARQTDRRQEDLQQEENGSIELNPSFLQAKKSSGESRDDEEYSDDEYPDDDEYDDLYDDDEDHDDDDEEDDDDDDDIALEIARPYTSQDEFDPSESLRQLGFASYSTSAAAASGSTGPSSVATTNFHSASTPSSANALYSNGLLSMFGNSSTTSTHNKLEKILKMIQQLEAKGLSEDEIEQQIQQNFPRLSSQATNATNRISSLSLDVPDSTSL